MTVKMTPEMIEAGAAEIMGGSTFTHEERQEMAEKIYRAMVASAPPPAVPDAVGVRAKGGIYVASKTRHAATWKAYRERGWPINSTWIDEAGVGESGDLNDLWRRCIREASSAAVLVVYREPDDVLKGGWVEVGAALASGVPVYAVGLEGFTIAHDKRIRHFETLDDAMDAAARYAATTAKSSHRYAAIEASGPVADAQLVTLRATIESRANARNLAALSSIEPTPSPEPQASNAGALAAYDAGLLSDYGGGDVDWWWRYIREELTRAHAFYAAQFAALTKPEPQTGERDKAIHDIAEAIGLGRNMCDDDGGGSTDLDVFRQAFFALDAVEQMLLAERAARKAAERRLAEVEERTREDERDRLLSAADHVNTPPYRVALRLFLREHGAMEPADRAALRAKPEAQAIVGKEAEE